jgi:hypothetical protein
MVLGGFFLFSTRIIWLFQEKFLLSQRKETTLLIYTNKSTINAYENNYYARVGAAHGTHDNSGHTGLGEL